HSAWLHAVGDPAVHGRVEHSVGCALSLRIVGIVERHSFLSRAGHVVGDVAPTLAVQTDVEPLHAAVSTASSTHRTTIGVPGPTSRSVFDQSPPPGTRIVTSAAWLMSRPLARSKSHRCR